MVLHFSHIMAVEVSSAGSGSQKIVVVLAMEDLMAGDFVGDGDD